jgi:hypothetical protein
MSNHLSMYGARGTTLNGVMSRDHFFGHFFCFRFSCLDQWTGSIVFETNPPRLLKCCIVCDYHFAFAESSTYTFKHLGNEHG